MKKIIMLLMFMLYLMIVGTAMADVHTIEIELTEDTIDAEYIYTENGKEVERVGQYRLRLCAVNEESTSDDFVSRILGESNKPVPPDHSFWDANLKDRMLEQLITELGAEDGDTVYFAFFDAEAQIFFGNKWDQIKGELAGEIEGGDRYYLRAKYPYSILSHNMRKMHILNALYLGESSLEGTESVWKWNIESVEYENIPGDCIWAYHDHLSPVMIGWIENPVAAPLNVPQTGDGSSLPGLFILLGMSVVAMGAIKLRRREN